VRTHNTRQHPKRRHQDPLRLLNPHWLAAPALPHGPLADRALQADDVPDAATGRAAEAPRLTRRSYETTLPSDVAPSRPTVPIVDRDACAACRPVQGPMQSIASFYML
jgi:alpha-beta hydrolase superfamily lysophospholipase